MPPLPLRVCPAWARSASSSALRINSDSAAAASISGRRHPRQPNGPAGIPLRQGQGRRSEVRARAARTRPARRRARPPPARRPALASAPRASPLEPSRNSSECIGSWWKSTVRSASARRAKESEWRERRVAPADVVGVLGVGVLAVVDQQRGVAGEAEAGDPVLVERVEVGAERRLVVGDVGERGVAVVDPVAEGRAAVGDRGGADPRRADLPLGLRAVAEGDVAGQLAHLDRRERRRDVAGDAVAQRGLRRGRAPDHDLGLGRGRRGRRRPGPGCGRGGGG